MMCSQGRLSSKVRPLISVGRISTTSYFSVGTHGRSGTFSARCSSSSGRCRATPRTRVPAGSVAIAAEFSAVYPHAAPGGWHLLGTTDASMWDERRAVPALVPPGARVRFVAR